MHVRASHLTKIVALGLFVMTRLPAWGQGLPAGKEGPVFFQITGTDPSGTTFVDPAHAPRKKCENGDIKS
jgi:hypothetical protein